MGPHKPENDQPSLASSAAGSEPGGSESRAPATPPASEPQPFAPSEREFMLNLARTALVNLTIGASEPELNEAPPWLEQPGACFVTLHKGAALRGCIGQVNVSGPLWRAIVRNAQGAARRDPRFAPLEAPELDRVKIEISVLTRPQRLAFASEAELLSQLRPHQHGVLLELEGCTATFLPQVWEQVPDKIDFLNRLTQKAGFPSGSWHRRDVSISVYQVEHFEEP